MLQRSRRQIVRLCQRHCLTFQRHTNTHLFPLFSPSCPHHLLALQQQSQQHNHYHSHHHRHQQQQQQHQQHLSFSNDPQSALPSETISFLRNDRIHFSLLSNSSSTMADESEYRQHCANVFLSWNTSINKQRITLLQFYHVHHDLEGKAYQRMIHACPSDWSPEMKHAFYVKNVLFTILRDMESCSRTMEQQQQNSSNKTMQVDGVNESQEEVSLASSMASYHSATTTTMMNDYSVMNANKLYSMIKTLYPSALTHRVNLLAYLRYFSSLFSVGVFENQYFVKLREDSEDLEVLTSMLPFTRIDIHSMSEVSLPQKPTIIQSHDQLADWIQAHVYDSGALVVGADTEWSQYNVNTVDVIQLATKNSVAVLANVRQNFKVWPNNFLDFLRDDNLKKVWAGGSQDISRLKNLLGVDPKGCIELDPRESGMSNLIALSLQLKFPKNKKVTRSNWSAPVLSNTQVHYAALDAFANLVYYDRYARHRPTICKPIA